MLISFFEEGGKFPLPPAEGRENFLLFLVFSKCFDNLHVFYMQKNWMTHQTITSIFLWSIAFSIYCEIFIKTEKNTIDLSQLSTEQKTIRSILPFLGFSKCFAKLHAGWCML